MDEENNNEPVERFRGILSGDEEELVAQKPENPVQQSGSQQTSKQQTVSPLDKLPRGKSSDLPERSSVQESVGQLPKPFPVQKSAYQSRSQTKLPEGTQAKQEMPRREKVLRALWTLTSVISMTVNIIVVIVVLLVLWLFRGFKIPEGIDVMVLNNLLRGLYSNFELMDAAKISTTIPVQDQIPVQFDLELNQVTTVTLSEDVTIRGAYVVINTPVIDINAPAVVTLPQGTNLPIILNLVVPVDKQVPVNLNVAVDIPLSETDLHTPFVGLQDVVRPLYCLVEPAATSSLTNEPVCEAK